MQNVDIAIIGGGPAALAAAIAAHSTNIQNILLLERNHHSLGGILNQCIHNGFGLHRFKKELTGPEYAHHDIAALAHTPVKTLLGTMVLNITPDLLITAASPSGILEIRARAIILAMGCRERPRGAINIPGSRPAGILTAGTAQKFVNIDGYMPGKNIVILGSGDIGLIMARRLTLEGAHVKAVLELMPHSTGLKRNIVQCLDDFHIPLMLSHTVTRVVGQNRVEAVEYAKVDADRNPVPGSEGRFDCDTLLLSVGLVPENELSKSLGVELSPVTGGPVVDENLQTSVPGVFACGNVLHVHDLVDFVSEESRLAGRNAARYIQGHAFARDGIPVVAAEGVRYAVPSRIAPENVDDATTIRFRVGSVFENARVVVRLDAEKVYERKARILAPGEMESVVFKREWFERNPAAKSIVVAVETAP